MIYVFKTHKPRHTHNFSELFQIMKTKSMQNNTNQEMFITHQESPIDTKLSHRVDVLMAIDTKLSHRVDVLRAISFHEVCGWRET